MSELADYYDSRWEKIFLPPYIESLYTTIDEIGLGKDDRVLDIACGNGMLGKYIMDKHGCSMYGVDISPVAIKHCQKQGYQCRVADLEKDSLPFKDSFFDVVLLSAVLEHVTDPASLIKQAYAKLRIGGRVVILTPNIEWIVNRFLFLLGKWDHRLMGGTRGHISYMSKRQLERATSEAHFENLNWNYSVLCVAGNSDICRKGLTGVVIRNLSNRRVRFLHSLLAFNFIVVAEKAR